MSSPDLTLVPYRPEWAATVASWAATVEEAMAWCSAGDVPIPASTVEQWASADDVEVWALLDVDEVVAYGEVWTDDEEAETELAHLIVAPSRRGAGVGVVLVRALAERASAVYPDVYMRMRPDNVAALRCYARAGFAPLSAADTDRFNEGQPTRYVWLRLSRG